MRRSKIILLISYLLLLPLFVFGMGATNTVPHHNEPVSILQALGYVLDAPKAELFHHYYIWEIVCLAVSVPIVLLAILTHRRSVFISCCAAAIVPLLFFEPPLILAVPVYAVVFTFSMLTGHTDGEFYSEGSLTIAALGWWVILWAALATPILWQFLRNRFLPTTPEHAPSHSTPNQPTT